MKPNIVNRPRAARDLATKGLLTTLLWLLPAGVQAQAIEAWVQRYDVPETRSEWVSALAVDPSGNVVVAIGCDGNADYVTMQYSTAGVPLWTNRYNGPGNGFDGVANMVMDSSGNVVVTGSSDGTSGNRECATIRYSNAGAPLWTNRYSGASGGTAAAVDSSGNVVVTGSSYGTSGNYECTTIKYSNAGALLWARTYRLDSPRALAVDTNGNVVVTGYVWGASDDYLTIKYSSAGVLLWTNRYNGPGNGIDRANGVAVDASGNVVVTGLSAGSRGYPDMWDYLTIMYSSAGVPLWTNRYNGPAVENDEARAVAVDTSGNVLVTGSDSGGDYATIQYSSAGVPLWTNRYNGPGNRLDVGRALALDAGGNVYVTGQSTDASGNMGIATVAYSSAGMPLWSIRYHGVPNTYKNVRAVAVDAQGNVYVAGTSRVSGTDDIVIIIKYVIPPIITRQPLNCTNSVGTNPSFAVEVAGGLPFGYQWRRNGTNLLDGGNLSGVTTTNLLIGNVQLSDALGYSVVVTNAYGSATSHVAQLTVTIPPSPGRFSNFSYSPTTGFSFVFRDATIDRPYRIQRAASPTEGGWSDWMNFTFTEPIVLTDLGAVTATNRFYRAVGPEP